MTPDAPLFVSQRLAPAAQKRPPDAIMGRIEHSITWMGVGDWSMREHAPGK